MLDIKNIGEIDCSVLYTTVSELSKEVGIGRSAILRHIHRNTINGFRISYGGRKFRVFIYPDDVQKFKALIDAGIIKPRSHHD